MKQNKQPAVSFLTRDFGLSQGSFGLSPQHLALRLRDARLRSSTTTKQKEQPRTCFCWDTAGLRGAFQKALCEAASSVR